MSSAQIPAQLSDIQLIGDLSVVLAIRHNLEQSIKLGK